MWKNRKQNILKILYVNGWSSWKINFILKSIINLIFKSEKESNLLVYEKYIINKNYGIYLVKIVKCNNF